MDFPSLHTSLDELPLQEARMQVEVDIARSLSILSRLRDRMNLLADLSRRLPEEIMTEIFIQYRSILKDASSSAELCSSTTTFYAFIRVTHVCRHWRRIALSFPRLWSYILVPRNVEFTEELLFRSKEVPLTVDARSIDHIRMPSLKCILQEMRRIRSLSVDTHPTSHWMITVDIANSSAPLLEHLSVNFSSPHSLRRILTLNIPNSLASMPQLRSLDLRNVGANNPFPLLFKTIRHLTVHETWSSTAGDPEHTMNRERLLASLANLPLLVTLDIDVRYPILLDLTVHRHLDIFLPHLESLRLIDSPAAVTWLPRCLRTPETCTLHLECTTITPGIHHISDVAAEVSAKLGGDQPDSLATFTDCSITRDSKTHRISLRCWSKLHPIDPVSPDATPHLHLAFDDSPSCNAAILETLFPGLHLRYLRSLYVGDIKEKDSIDSLANPSALKVLYLRGWHVREAANFFLQQMVSWDPALSPTDPDTMSPPGKIIFPSLDLLILSNAQFDDYPKDDIAHLSLPSRAIRSGYESISCSRGMPLLLTALKARMQWNAGIRQVDLNSCRNLALWSVEKLATEVTCRWDGRVIQLPTGR